MQMSSINNYLNSSVKTPYFLFVGDEKYRSVINGLKTCELIFVPMSSFCSGDDKVPDIDGLFSHIEAADINTARKRFVVTGLGELLALKGMDEATRVLSRLKDLNVGGAKVVLLLRGLSPLINSLKSDPRFDDRRHSIIGKLECDLSFTFASHSIGLSTLSGFKAMLTELENGRSGDIAVNTTIYLDKAIFTTRRINNAHEGIKFIVKGFDVAYSCGSNEKWTELLSDINQNNNSLDAVFKKYDVSSSLESNFYSPVAGTDYKNWLYFIHLKYRIDKVQNSYLRFVLEKTERFEEFTKNVLNTIIEIPHTNERFNTFYQERKSLVQKFPESDVANFIINNRRTTSESIYKLTDGTESERREIIDWISRNQQIPQLEKIYPALDAYLKKYVFKCFDLSELLTDYFETYKRQKLFNILEPEFSQNVDELAISRRYNILPTRNEIMDGMDKKDGTYLYWLDALGVEYLGFIESLAQKHNLSIRVSITRAELPTITSINRGFFDEWSGAKNGPNGDKRLDDIKHNEKEGYVSSNNRPPVHLAEELEIISSVVDKAATELALKKYKRFLIVSDHGASRLAVLRRKEEKYDTDSSGIHSGRCCKLFQPYDLPFAAEENGYLVLADYGRFKGSRAANIEVHGGASLEEVVIPVIELTLKDKNIVFKLINEEVTVNFRTGTEIDLFFDLPVKNVSVVLNGKSYKAVKTGENHYNVILSDIKKAGTYLADVYIEDDLIDKISIKAQSKSGKIDDVFDNLF